MNEDLKVQWRVKQVEDLTRMGVPNLVACQGIDMAMKAWEDMREQMEKTIGLLENKDSQLLAKAILSEIIMPAWSKSVSDKEVFLKTVTLLCVKNGQSDTFFNVMMEGQDS